MRSIITRIIPALCFLLICATQTFAQIIEVDPSEINFGQVNIGNNATQSLTITNNNEITVTVGVTLTDGGAEGFSIFPSGSVSIPAFGSTTVNVTFAPTIAGLATGNVNVSVPDSEGDINVPLTGEGVAVAQISVNPTSIDFGTVTVGDTELRAITVTNIGSGRVVLQPVRLSNVAVQDFIIATQPLNTLEPGQSSSFVVGFRPVNGSSGVLTNSVIITTNGGSATVALRGTVAPPGFLEVNPSLLDFGTVDIGNTASGVVTVTNSGSSTLDFTIAQANGQNDGFTITTAPGRTNLRPGESTTFTVSFQPTREAASTGLINVRSGNRNLTVLLRGNGRNAARPILTVNPTTINFGSVNLGDSASQVVTLSNTGNAPLTINGVALLTNGANGGFAIASQPASTTLAPGSSTTFTVSFTPIQGNNTSVDGMINITSNGGNGTVSLIGSGNTLTQPSMSINPSSINFGDVVLGEQRTINFTITNTGGANSAPLQISSITAQALSGLNIFQVDSPSQSIPPGGSAQVRVTFAPTAVDGANASTAQLIITSNAGQPIQVSTTGRGILRLSVQQAGSNNNIVRVLEQRNGTLTLQLTGQPPTGGITVRLIARFDDESRARVLNQNLDNLAAIESRILSNNLITFTELNEERNITINAEDIEIGPEATVLVTVDQNTNPGVQLPPLTVIVRPDNTPDLLRTFNCNGCQASFTQQGDQLTVILAYFDRNRDVNRLLISLRNDRGETFTLPVITTDSNPALPVGTRGFALRLTIVDISSFGNIQSVDLLLQDRAGNIASASLPDNADSNRNQLFLNNSTFSIKSSGQHQPRLKDIELIPLR